MVTMGSRLRTHSQIGAVSRKVHLDHMPTVRMTARLQGANGVTLSAPTDAGTWDSTDLTPCSLAA